MNLVPSGKNGVIGRSVQAGAHLVSQPPTPEARTRPAGYAQSVRLNRSDSESLVRDRRRLDRSMASLVQQFS
jgi:hypothetical protein